MEWKFEEKETYSLEEVKDLIEGFKSEVEQVISTKDALLEKFKDVDVDELQSQNLQLQQKNLALKNNIDDDLLEFVIDEDLDKMQEKIDKFKELSKEKEIDNSFKPEGKGKADDQYEKAIKDGDVEGAIKHKFNRLFLVIIKIERKINMILSDNKNIKQLI